ncbi:MAG TPA: VOC family protein [Candidatus Nitrosotenuis sp.]|jgi:PhnB protein|nr:VOC family protein [Candidatus Nitrosotenuis sp.]
MHHTHYPAMIPYLVVEDTQTLLDFFTQKLGFREVMKMEGPGGKPAHAEVALGQAFVMMGFKPGAARPNDSVNFYIDPGMRIDSYYEFVKSKGVEIEKEIADQFYGDRTFTVKTPMGFSLCFYNHVRDVSRQEMEQAIRAMAGAGA